MDLTVRTREGTIKCVQCSECNAGYEPYPPCHTSEIFNEIGLQKMCVQCRHGFFKQVHDGKPNTLMCKSCSTVKCRDNFIVLHNCTRNSPAVCADICKIGFAKDPFGNCIQVCFLYIMYLHVNFSLCIISIIDSIHHFLFEAEKKLYRCVYVDSNFWLISLHNCKIKLQKELGGVSLS